MIEKHADVATHGANPFIDAANCNVETDIMETVFRAALEEQQAGKR